MAVVLSGRVEYVTSMKNGVRYNFDEVAITIKCKWKGEYVENILEVVDTVIYDFDGDTLKYFAVLRCVLGNYYNKYLVVIHK